MIGAEIYYGKNTLVVELPMGPLDLQMKLSSIGVGEPADRIPLKDDEERQLQVKLYASSPEEAHLLSLLTSDRSLADANTCVDLLWQAERRALPRLKCGLLADSYRSMDEFVEAAQKVFADCQAQKTVQAGKSENRDAVLEEFRKNPNIRVVVIDTLTLHFSDYFPEATKLKAFDTKKYIWTDCGKTEWYVKPKAQELEALAQAADDYATQFDPKQALRMGPDMEMG